MQPAYGRQLGFRKEIHKERNLISDNATMTYLSLGNAACPWMNRSGRFCHWPEGRVSRVRSIPVSFSIACCYQDTVAGDVDWVGYAVGHGVMVRARHDHLLPKCHKTSIIPPLKSTVHTHSVCFFGFHQASIVILDPHRRVPYSSRFWQ